MRARRLLHLQSENGSDIDAKVKNPVSGGIAPLFNGREFLLSSNRCHGLGDQAGRHANRCWNRRLPVRTIRPNRGPRGHLAAGIIDLPLINVAVHHRSIPPHPGLVAADHLSRSVRINHDHLQAQHGLAIRQPARHPHRILCEPSLAQHDAEAVIAFAQKRGDIESGVKGILFVIADGRVEQTGWINRAPVYVELSTTQTAEINRRTNRPRTVLCSQIHNLAEIRKCRILAPCASDPFCLPGRLAGQARAETCRLAPSAHLV